MGPSWRRRYSRSPVDTQLAAFRSAVLRHERDDVISFKPAHWRSAVQTEMPRIFEVIEKISSEDRYQVEDVFTEADADAGGKWEQYIADKYATEHEGLVASSRVVLSLELQRMLYKKGYEIHGEWSDETPFYDSDGDEILELKVTRPAQRRPRLGRSTLTTDSDSNAISGSKDCGDTPEQHKVLSDPKADAKTQCMEVDENTPCQSFFNTSDEEDLVRTSNGQGVTKNPSSFSAGTSSESQLAIRQLFRNFPACFVSLFCISEENEQYRVSSLTEAQHWIAIQSDLLPRFVREWVAKWILQDSASLDAASSSTSQTSSRFSDSWLLITHSNEVIINMLTLDIWFRPLAVEPSVHTASLRQKSSNTLLESTGHNQQQQPQQETEEENQYLRDPRHAFFSKRRRLRRYESQRSVKPDATNSGPQIRLTNPSGFNFYLIAPDVSDAPQLD